MQGLRRGHSSCSFSGTRLVLWEPVAESNHVCLQGDFAHGSHPTCHQKPLGIFECLFLPTQRPGHNYCEHRPGVEEPLHGVAAVGVLPHFPAEHTVWLALARDIFCLPTFDFACGDI